MREWTRDGVTYRTAMTWTCNGVHLTATKAYGDRFDDWDPKKHPRDARGRFIRKNAEVRITGGMHDSLGRVIGREGGHSNRLLVERDSDGMVVRVPPQKLVTTGRDRPDAGPPGAMGRDAVDQERDARGRQDHGGAAELTPETVKASSSPATLRPDLTTSYRNTINEYGFDSPDGGHPQVLRDAAAAVRGKRPLTADQAQALGDALRARKAKEPAARGRVLDRIAVRMDTVSHALTGIRQEHVPAQKNAQKAHPGEVVEGDTIALPGRGGTADVRKVVSSQEFYGQYKMQLEAPDGSREERLVHPTSDVYLLPDAPDPVPVPPKPSGGREHLTPDRLRPGDRIDLGDGTDAEVESVSSWTPGHFKVKVKRGGNGGTTELLRGDGSGYPSVVRTRRGDASQAQPWDSVLPDDKPTPITADKLKLGDRFTYQSGFDRTRTGVVLSITRSGPRNDPRWLVGFRGDDGRGDTIELAHSETLIRVAEGGPGAAERIAAEKAAAQRRVVATAVRHELELADEEAQRRLAQRAAEYVDTLTPQMPVATREQVVARVEAYLKGQISHGEVGHLDNEVAYGATNVVRQVAPDADGNDLVTLQEQLVPLLRDAAAQGRKRAMDRILETLRNTEETPDGTAYFSRMRHAVNTLANTGSDTSADYDKAAKFLAEIAPDLKGKMGLTVADAKVPTLPEGTDLKTRMQAYRDALGKRFGAKTVRVQSIDKVRLADLEAGRAPQPKEVTRVVSDRADDGGPGETAMTHLAVVRAAGKDLDAELQRRIDADLAKIQATDDDGERARLRKLADRAKANMEDDRTNGRNAFARQHGYPSYLALISALDESEPRSAEYFRLNRLMNQARDAGDRFAEPQFQEFMKYQKEMATLKVAGELTHRKRAAIRRKHALDLLNEVRDTGVGGAKLKYVGGRGAAKSEADPLVKAMRFAEAGYPTDWLNKSKQRHKKPIVLKQVNRGYHRAGWTETTIALSPGVDKIEGGPGVREVASANVADHELGHEMEHSVPGLVEAQEALLWDRTATGPIGSRTRPPTTTIYGDEKGWKDDFPEHYTGKDYGGRNYEVFTTAKESLTAGSQYLDDDLRQWLLGVLATL